MVVMIYGITSAFPADERFGLSQQLRRAAVSVASNIAEGCGRSSHADLARFLAISSGSVSECESQLITAQRLGYITEDAAREALDVVDHVRRKIHNLRRSVVRDRNALRGT
jgi:four helix bundle protein